MSGAVVRCGTSGHVMTTVSSKEFAKTITARARKNARDDAIALARMLTYISQEAAALHAPLTHRLADAALDALRLELRIESKSLF